MLWRRMLGALILFTAGLATSCVDSSPATPLPDRDSRDAGQVMRELPTLYPTATTLPTALPTDTRPPQPTTVPATEVPYDQVVVDLRYSIPALNLDRRIHGNVAGEVEVVDEETDTSVTLKNRAGVLLEMQQALPRATIEEQEAECEACVYLEYRLPLTEQSGEGRLTDIQMLASLENYTSLFLGPHFPPGTIIGLRREATPFEVAHTAAFTDDGRLWAWTATEAQITSSEAPTGTLSGLQLDLNAIDWENLADSYGQSCYDGNGRETMMLAGPDGPKLIDLYCPDLFLPGQLQPIYLSLSRAVGAKLEGSDLPPPELPFSAESRVVYLQEDGAKLDLKYDGQLHITDSQGITFTTAITAGRILSLTEPLLDSDIMESGLANIMSEDPGNLIVLRAADGVYELAWSEADTLVEALIRPWNDLLESIIREMSEENVEEAEETPTPTPADTDDS